LENPSIKSISGEILYIIPNVNLVESTVNFCPISQTKGLIIKKITLRGHVQEKYWDIISDQNYFFCLDEVCPIIYFNNTDNYYFTANDVKTRVSQKNGSEPRPICYCLNVLEHRILDEILVNKCCTTLEDIKRYTGARTGKFCHITNPSGRCCGLQVNEIIAKGLKLLKKDSSLVQEVLKTVHSGCEYCQDTSDLVDRSINEIIDTCSSCGISTENIK